MLSDQEKAALAGLSREELLKLWLLARQARAEMAGSGCMPPSAIQDLVNAVGDKQVREIVHDLRSGRAEPGFLPPDGSLPKKRGSGWQKPAELGSPPGLKYIDQLVDAQDAMDKRDLEKRLRGG
jgi:hypothetical protein